uniref:DUF19 domain-containing protein n=1 Tax=Caenorhabditis tropicalis TaxID=1561998 RepID=A0A1I7UWA9_9PELO
MLIFSILVLVALTSFKANAAPAQNFTKYCTKIDPSFEQYEYCISSAKHIIEFDEFFQKFHFGSPDFLKIIDETRMQSIQNLCVRYSNCPPTNKFHCFLPRMNSTRVCTKFRILRSPFGLCMKKFQFSKPKSVALEAYLKDFTNYGVSRKCNDLRYPSEVMKGIYFECGEPAEESFRTLIPTLKTYFDC